jgi:hypothetical protein
VNDSIDSSSNEASIGQPQKQLPAEEQQQDEQGLGPSPAAAVTAAADDDAKPEEPLTELSPAGPVTPQPQSGEPQDNSRSSSSAPDTADTDADAAAVAAMAMAASAAFDSIPTSPAPEAAPVTTQHADATCQALPLPSLGLLSQDSSDSSRTDDPHPDSTADTLTHSSSSSSSSKMGRQHAAAAPFPMSPTHSSSLFPIPRLNPVTYTPSSPPGTTPHPYNMQLRRRSSGGLAEAHGEPMSPSSSCGPYSPR